MKVFAPGRVNLMGDHTDYTHGLVFPMAIDLGITLRGRSAPGHLTLSSELFSSEASVELPLRDLEGVEPRWMRYPAAVAAELRADVGFVGTITSTLPIAGLSSSAALTVATALALGARGGPVDIASLCQRAERRATGIRTGLLDQLACVAGIEGQALRIDCHTLDIAPTSLPDDAELVVVHSGQHRNLADTGYGERRRQCEVIEARIGPLREAVPGDERQLEDSLLRRRARHVLTENRRVDMFAGALSAGELDAAGAIMDESHRSLRDDFEISTPEVDALVEGLRARDGVYGVRMTGGGFGGAVVAMSRPGALAVGWHVRPSRGARVLSDAPSER